MGSQDNNAEEIVLTAVKTEQGSMMRMERKKKHDIDYNLVHHVAGGPYKGILINKQADGLDTVHPPEEHRVEFMAYLINSDHSDEAVKDKWILKFWFRGNTDGVTKKKTFTDYFSELISPQSLPRKYVGFIKRALVLLQSYPLVMRLELEVVELDGGEELPPIKSFVSVFTPDTYIYRFVPEVAVDNKNSLTFKLKSRGEASLSLCAVYGDVETKTYEICFGAEGNNVSYIRDSSLGPIKAEAKTVNILSENEFRFFWVSWSETQVEVGRGAHVGQARFLQWDVPPARQFSVHSMAVATSKEGKGQWEFAEIIDEKDLHKDSKRHDLKVSILWLAKKQKMLQVLEEAYPNAVGTSAIFRLCKVSQSDNITAIVALKGLERKGLIQEVEKGAWLRMQTKDEVTDHDVRLVSELPTIPSAFQPEVAVVTSVYQEKQAVDAMLEGKLTFVKRRAQGHSEIYTIGKIGRHNVVTTKLSQLGERDKDRASTENTVNKLFQTFPKVQHLLLVGVGGAVPNYTDVKEHVRLGDVVVSLPTDTTGSLYVYCSRVEKKESGPGFSFITRVFSPSQPTLVGKASRLKRQSESSYSPRPWEDYIEQGKDALRGQDSNFHRPNIRDDKLFYTEEDGSVIQVEHPQPTGYQARNYREGQTQIRYGLVACGQRVSRCDPVRRDFAQLNKIKAFHSERDTVFEATEGCGCHSYLLVLGMCDYSDGSKQGWRCYASLAAAAYMKALLLTL